MKHPIVTASILVALAGSAAARPGMTSGAAAPAPLDDDKAFALSLGGTLGSYVVLLSSFGLRNDTARIVGVTAGGAGAMLAPGFGHWYAGAYLTRGTMIRLAGGALLGAAFYVAVEYSAIFKGDPADFDRGAADSFAYLGGLAGAVIIVGGTIDDVVTAPRRVRRLNRARAGVAIAPFVTPHATGLALGGWF